MIDLLARLRADVSAGWSIQAQEATVLLEQIDALEARAVAAEKRVTELAPVDKIDAVRALRRIDLHYREVITAYADGRWERAYQQGVFGLVPIAARDGTFAGWVDVLHKPRANGVRFVKVIGDSQRADPIRTGVRPEDVHIGWWFSRAMPHPQVAPSW